MIDLHERIDAVIDESIRIEDLAMDFVEQELGRFDFVRNWQRQQDKPGRVSRWLALQGETDPDTVNAVSSVLDRWAADEKQW